MKTALITVLLLVCCFGAGTMVEPRLGTLEIYKRHEGSPIKVLLGESRRLFAAQAFAKADAYFHSGMYPSIFDNNDGGKKGSAMTGAARGEKGGDHVERFLGEPRDIIDRFSRSFFPSEHKHLGEEKHEEHFPGDGHDHHEHEHEHAHEHGEHGQGEEHHEDEETGGKDVREILPWLQLTAELDPNRIENYVVGSYWLRTQLGKVAEAEQFLRLGLKNNPNSYEILFELGRIHDENKHDAARARNLYEAALARWRDQNSKEEEPDNFALQQIAMHLANLEIKAGNTQKGIALLEIVKKISPRPDAVQQQIDDLRAGKETGKAVNESAEPVRSGQ